MAKRPRKRAQDRGRKRPEKGLPGLEFHDDPADFLKAARSWLAADPVVSSVVTTIAERSVREDRDGVEHDLPHRWWVVVRDELGEVVGAGMRTAPFAPHPLFLLSMPSDAAAALAHVLHARGEHVGGVNGALPAANVCAGVLAMLQGEVADVALRSRLHEARAVVAPRPAPGRLRLAREDEIGLVLEWFDAFAVDAAEQAGRTEGPAHDLAEDEDDIRRRIAEERTWFWVDEDDTPVHLTGHNLPALGSARIGPVFTPREHRGKGYAGNAVAQVAQRLLDGGSRACLYTDQANPASNALYAALGFEPVVDMVEMRIG